MIEPVRLESFVKQESYISLDDLYNVLSSYDCCVLDLRDLDVYQEGSFWRAQHWDLKNGAKPPGFPNNWCCIYTDEKKVVEEAAAYLKKDHRDFWVIGFSLEIFANHYPFLMCKKRKITETYHEDLEVDFKMIPSRILLQDFQWKVYVGGKASISKTGVKYLGITHFVNASNVSIKSDLVGMGLFSPKFKILEVFIADNPEAKIEKHFKKVVKFLSAARKKRAPTVVFCQAGISRSVTLLACFLIHSFGMSDYEAIQTIKRSRFSANPNEGFRAKLKEYHQKQESKKK